MQFIPGLNHPRSAHRSRWFILAGDQILVHDSRWHFSEDEAGALLPDQPKAVFKVGQWAEPAGLTDCHCLLLAPDVQLTKGVLSPLRPFLLNSQDAEFLALGAAVQLSHWFRDHQFCGRCGGPNRLLADERALCCDSCRHQQFPRLSPCVIMLVTRGDYCLLARHRRASSSQMFSALAGFVEPGESLESAVVREVLEEVGLQVQVPEYQGSQPWPFPGQLMAGFLVAAQAGELCLQDAEIAEAQWFHYRQLPAAIPPAQTLSGQLIRAFVARRMGDGSAGI